MLNEFSAGDRAKAEIFLREVLPQLHRIAVRELRRERYAAPISATELIHESWIHSLGKGGWQVKDRAHFYALAARAMRHVLVDLARKRLSKSRGNGTTPLALALLPSKDMPRGASPAEIVQIHLIVEQLTKSHPDEARVIDMHYFAGFTLEEISENTGLSVRRVRYLWDKGRERLGRQLTHQPSANNRSQD